MNITAWESNVSHTPFGDRKQLGWEVNGDDNLQIVSPLRALALTKKNISQPPIYWTGVRNE